MEFRKRIGILALVVSGCLQAQAGTPKPEHLPLGVLKALASNEAEYCDHYENRTGCHQKFRANLLSRRLSLTPSGRTAILIESHVVGSCGSAGCSLYLFFQQPNGKFSQILGTQGDVGALESIKVLKTVSNGWHNLQKNWADGKSHTKYQWNGVRYVGH